VDQLLERAFDDGKTKIQIGDSQFTYTSISPVAKFAKLKKKR
jgi:hypothetical protein